MDLSYASPRRTELFGTLGPLELRVLETLCARGEATSRQVMEDIGANYAYTSISTTIERLVTKGIVRRRKEDRKYVYAANLTPQDLLRARSMEILRSWFASANPELIVSQLVDCVADYDAALLDELERRVQERLAKIGQGARDGAT